MEPLDTDPVNTKLDSRQMLFVDNQLQWQSINPRYVRVLQFRLLMVLVIVFFGNVISIGNFIEASVVLAIDSAILLALLWVSLVLMPRKVCHTRYYLSDINVNLQKGYWFRRTISVPINRVQHLEVTQNPIERWLNLSCLVVYTAGGYQSDLVIPGLDYPEAMQLKQQLLNKIASEELDDESFSSR